MGWIGVDLDGTLAHYEGWKGADVIGAPIMPMVRRVQAWLATGQEVRIFTARAWPGTSPERAAEAEKAVAEIKSWCIKHIGFDLPVTCVKDFGMLELWDDRAVRVKPNTGHPCCSS